MGMGILITKCIDIGSFSQLFPVCLALSGMSIYANYMSVTQVDENYLNN